MRNYKYEELEHTQTKTQPLFVLLFLFFFLYRASVKHQRRHGGQHYQNEIKHAKKEKAREARKSKTLQTEIATRGAVCIWEGPGAIPHLPSGFGFPQFFLSYSVLQVFRPLNFRNFRSPSERPAKVKPNLRFTRPIHY